MPSSASINRRNFLKSGAILSAGLTSTAALGFNDAPEHDFNKEGELFMIGPLPGYSPHIGTLVSMLNYNRSTILDITRSMTTEQLDHLVDEKANSIGALLLHLAAVDKWYYMDCFEKRRDFTAEEKAIWEPAMELGNNGRQSIKGKELRYYVDLLTTTRAQTLKALKGKDDRWLLAADAGSSNERKINNYWKWFHVCEHESNHRGQIAWLKGRIPAATGNNKNT